MGCPACAMQLPATRPSNPGLEQDFDLHPRVPLAAPRLRQAGQMFEFILKKHAAAAVLLPHTYKEQGEGLAGDLT